MSDSMDEGDIQAHDQTGCDGPGGKVHRGARVQGQSMSGKMLLMVGWEGLGEFGPRRFERAEGIADLGGARIEPNCAPNRIAATIPWNLSI